MFATEHITSDEAFFRLKAEWNELLRISACPSIFLTWEWQYNWWQHFKAGRKLHLVIIRDESNNLIGIGPFCIERFELLKMNRLSFIGNNKVCSDFLDIIVHSHNSRAVAAYIIQFIQEHLLEWDIAEFSDVQESSPLIGNALLKSRHHYAVRQKEICPYIKMPADLPDFLSHLSSRTRRNIRNYERRLCNHFGVQFVEVDQDDDMENIIDILFQLHRTRRTTLSLPSTLSDKRMQQFLKTVLQQFRSNDWVKYYALKNDNGIFAVCCMLRYKNQFYLYQGGFDNKFLPSNISIMPVLLYFCVQQAMELKIENIHLLQGETQFKTSFTGCNINTKTIIVGKNFKYFVYLIVTSLSKKMKSMLKSLISPRYRSMFRGELIKLLI